MRQKRHQRGRHDRWVTERGGSTIGLSGLSITDCGRLVAGQVRGAVFTATAHLAAKAAIAVVSVPARGTSSGCPRCGNPVKHVKAPDRTVAGYRWTTCTCGLTLDRDHAAAQRITARGLANQTTTRRTPHGAATIRAAIDVPVHPRTHRPDRAGQAAPKPVRDRRKTGPTRRRGGTTRTSPLPPWRRQTPAPATPTGAGKRPAGRQPQATHPGRQVPHTISDTTRHPHRVRAAILGRGFHRHVHATPITIRDGNTGRMPESLRIT